MSQPPGLEWRRWLEPAEEFVRHYGRERHRWALACTYELELATLQKSVLPILSRRGSAFSTIVLVDAGVLERVLEPASAPLTGAVNLHSVRVPGGGLFHPKLLLLRAGAHVRVCFGSANLTSGGFGGNLELWTHSDDPEIVGGVVAFLYQMIATTGMLDVPAIRCLRRALLGLTGKPSSRVWSTLHSSFKVRLDRDREATGARAFAVSPLYASATGLRAARDAIPAKHLTLCTNLHVKLKAGKVRILRTVPTDQEFDDDDRIPSWLHAKAYIFERPDRCAVVWSGSANFTVPALVKSVKQGGNVELMVRAILPHADWTRLKQDLLVDLFDAPSGPYVAAREIGKAASVARATVTGCELFAGANGMALVIYSSRKQGVVTLRHNGGDVRVKIKDGRGFVDGVALRKFLPGIELGAATAFAIQEVVKGKAIAIVVNVPHLPPGPDEGGVGQVALSALAADLLGRVPVYRAKRTLADDDDADEIDCDSEKTDESPDDLERRLDEVQHQGRLDQEAVTLAVLEKLARGAPKNQQRELRTEILRIAEHVVSPHLREVVRRLFRGRA